MEKSDNQVVVRFRTYGKKPFQRVGRDPSTIRRSVQYSWNGKQRSELLDTAGDWARRGFTEHVIILPPADAERVASLAAEALGDLRSLSQ